jgi:hypothetical protein
MTRVFRFTTRPGPSSSSLHRCPCGGFLDSGSVEVSCECEHHEYFTRLNLSTGVFHVCNRSRAIPEVGPSVCDCADICPAPWLAWGSCLGADMARGSPFKRPQPSRPPHPTLGSNPPPGQPPQQLPRATNLRSLRNVDVRVMYIPAIHLRVCGRG